MNIPLDEVIYFDCITTHPSTGAATDADSTPTFEIFEEATDTDIGVGGNLTKRTSKTGNYRGSATLSAANGFEVGKWYTVIGYATVNSIAGKGVLKNFRVVAAEAVAGYPKNDAQYVEGSDATDQINAACDTACADQIVVYKLDHLAHTADSDDVADNSIIAKLASKGATADWSSYVNTTDSLEANRDNIGTNGASLACSVSGYTIAGALAFVSNSQAAMQGYGLDHLFVTALPTGWSTDVAANTVFALLAGATFDSSTDSNEAIRNHVGDGTNLTEAGGTGDHLTALALSAAGVDAIWDELMAELTTDPGATPKMREIASLLYMKHKNSETSTATAATIKNDAGTTVLTATLSDDNTTFTKGKYS